MENPKAPTGQVVIQRVDVLTRAMYPAGCFARKAAIEELDRLNGNRKGVAEDYYLAFDDEGGSVKGSIDPEVLDTEAQ